MPTLMFHTFVRSDSDFSTASALANHHLAVCLLVWRCDAYRQFIPNKANTRIYSLSFMNFPRFSLSESDWMNRTVTSRTKIKCRRSRKSHVERTWNNEPSLSRLEWNCRQERINCLVFSLLVHSSRITNENIFFFGRTNLIQLSIR